MPVHSLFDITCRVVDQVKELDTYRAVLALADTMENEFAPKAELRNRVIDFEPITLETLTLRRCMTLVNVGQAALKWRLSSEEAALPPPWLMVHPRSGTLARGEVSRRWRQGGVCVDMMDECGDIVM